MHKILTEIKKKKKYFLASALIFVADFISKHFIDEYLQEIVVKKIIGELLVFVYTRNYGVAFGLLNNLPESFQNMTPIFLKIVVAAAMIVVFCIMLSVNPKKQKMSMIGFTMILGGAMGNLADRIMRGYVTDFISMGFNETIRFPYHYNIADASITIGIFIIAIGVFFLKEDFERKDKVSEISEDNIDGKNEEENGENKTI